MQVQVLPDAVPTLHPSALVLLLLALATAVAVALDKAWEWALLGATVVLELRAQAVELCGSEE